jgi:hypothetical protein
MSKMMVQWLQKAIPGGKGLTRPPVSHALVNTRMRSYRLLVDFSKSNSGCQDTNTSTDKHMIHRNGRTLLRGGGSGGEGGGRGK